jgi:AraC-like DNA-binding protein
VELTHTPVRCAEMVTKDLAVAEELLSRDYVDYRSHQIRHREDFVFRAQSASVDGCGVDRVRNWANLTGTVDALGEVAALVVTAGRYAIREDDDYRPVAPGTAVLLPTGTPVPIRWDRVDVRMVRFPIAAVTRAAGRLGVDPVDFRFAATAPLSAVHNRHWLSTVEYLERAFDGPEPAIAYPLLRASMLQTLAAVALAVFPNTTMNVDYAAGPGRTAPAAIRRAIAHLDAHAAEPLTLEQVAAAAGVSVRGLQAGFARHRGVSPMAYLRRVRMERAHRDLQAGDRSCGDTVAVIARRWGFASPGRFAVEYRKVFGRSPGHTLRA